MVDKMILILICKTDVRKYSNEKIQLVLFIFLYLWSRIIIS